MFRHRPLEVSLGSAALSSFQYLFNLQCLHNKQNQEDSQKELWKLNPNFFFTRLKKIIQSVRKKIELCQSKMKIM